MNECPICYGNPDKDNRAVMDQLAMQHHLVQLHMISGGRELEFRDKGRLQLFTHCRTCEENQVRAFLGEPWD